MQLGRRNVPLPSSHDVATALRAAAERFGHRPAITVLRPDRRDEQGFASLAQWAAKGAHYLEVDHLAGPDAPIALDAPPGWPGAAVALACWWIGAPLDGSAEVVVRHEDRAEAPGSGQETVWIGDAVDGSPTRAELQPVYAVEVQAFPDQPPIPRAAGALPAVVADGAAIDQSELLRRARTLPGDGVVGIDADAPPELWLPAVVLRPLVTGAPTVVLAGAERSAAAQERVSRWLTPHDLV